MTLGDPATTLTVTLGPRDLCELGGGGGLRGGDQSEHPRAVVQRGHGHGGQPVGRYGFNVPATIVGMGEGGGAHGQRGDHQRDTAGDADAGRQHDREQHDADRGVRE